MTRSANSSAAKEGLLGKWRALSRTAAGKETPPKKGVPPATKLDPVAAKAALPELVKQAGEADAKIRETARPQKLHFVLTPTK